MILKKDHQQMSNSTMPNNIMVSNEKMFRTLAPWRLNSSYIGQLSKDHKLLLFDNSMTDASSKQYLSTNRLSQKLYNYSQTIHGHLVFMGIGNDTQVLLDLYHRYGFKFDTAILINNTVPIGQLECLMSFCAVYNFTTKTMDHDNYIDWAEVNQHVKTILPAHLSNRLALEVAGCLIYDRYEQMYLDDNYSKIEYV